LGDAALELEDDAVQSSPVVYTRSTTFGFKRLFWQQRSYYFPQFVTH
jgi:hypothetical protein